MAERKSKKSLKQSTPEKFGLTAHIDGQEFHLGYSRIAKFEDCPRQYKFSYVDGIRIPGGPPMRRGTAYHAALEFLLTYKKDHDGELLSVERAEKAAIRAAKAENLTESEIYRVIDAVRFYHAEMYSEHQPLALEEDFTIERGGVKLTGRIDLVDMRGRIIDFKFSADKWAAPRARYGCQPIIYQWCGLDCLPKRYPTWEYTGFSYEIIKLWPMPLIQQIHIDPIPQDQSDWWEEQIAQIAATIKAGLFPARPTEKGCGWCGHKAQCNPAIWKIRTNDVGETDVTREFDDGAI
jgi:RecB family exonuclease